MRRNSWKQERKYVSRYDTMKMLTMWKVQHPELCIVNAQVLQEVCTRVDLAFSAFFRRVKSGERSGYPRFKSTDRYDSFTFPQSGFSLVEEKLRLSKIGNIKIVLHRQPEGRVKTLTVWRSPTGKWYANFSCDIIQSIPSLIVEKVVGIDVGIEKFAMLSTGEHIDNPRFFRHEEKELAKKQRRLSKSGSEKNRKIVSRIHERIANRRSNFAHQSSTGIVDKFDVICLEKLNIGGMVHNHSLAKSISDAAWGKFAQYIQYKAAEAGKECVLVDPHNTSKKCSRCGTLVEKTLSIRIHDCPICGLKIDRDENAAINILRLGLQSLGEIPRSHTVLTVME